MKPTPKLRFVVRPQPVAGDAYRHVRFLQQWWEEIMTVDIGWTGDIAINTRGEWRDVPLEKEE